MPIYFVQGTRGGPIKIGWSKNPKEALRHLQPGNPEPLQIVLLLQREQREEKSVHARFAEDRIRGDWYWPSKNLTTEIAKMGGKSVVAVSGGPAIVREAVVPRKKISLTTIQEQMRDENRMASSYSNPVDFCVLIRLKIAENEKPLSSQDQTRVSECLQKAAQVCGIRCFAGAATPRGAGMIVECPVGRSLESIATSIKKVSAELAAQRGNRLRDTNFRSKLWAKETSYYAVSPEDDISHLMRLTGWIDM